MNKHFVRALETENMNNFICQPKLIAQTNNVTFESTKYSTLIIVKSLKGLKTNYYFCMWSQKVSLSMTLPFDGLPKSSDHKCSAREDLKC